MNCHRIQPNSVRYTDSYVLDLRSVSVRQPRRRAHDIVAQKSVTRPASRPVRPEASLRPTQPRRVVSPFVPTTLLSPLRTLALLLIITLNTSALYVIGPTSSFYSDPEGSDTNAFTTGLVDFVLEATPFEHMATTTPVTEVWNVDVVPHEVSNPFYYYASSTNFHGNLDLCAVINVVATLDGEVMYEGLLTELLTGTTTVISEWEFVFSDFIGDFPGEMCHFDIDFNGWQTRHDLDQGGYSDTETVEFWITDPSIVIAKVFFADPDNDRHEWVELYNPIPIDIDISGWQLCDDAVCNTIPTTTPIEPNETVLVYANDDVPDEMFVPDEVVLVELAGDVIGDGLNVDADMLQLITDEGFTADQINWGDPDMGWANYVDTLWDPGIPVTAAGRALARVPIFVDTDQPEDFVELRLPTLEIIDPDEDSVWEEGTIQTIRWNAENHNGPDEDLQIDIYFIDASSTVHTIVLDTPNDGEFNWQVMGEVGTSRQIRIVATGPENVLLNTTAENTIGCVDGPDGACDGLELIFEKKFSGPSLGFTADQFLFHIYGDGIDSLVPHGESIILPIGSYTIEEIGPEGFDVPDWRIQWSGDTCTGENIAGGLAYIDVEEDDLRKVYSFCRADNQFRPEDNSETYGAGDGRGGDRTRSRATTTRDATTATSTASSTDEMTKETESATSTATTTDQIIEPDPLPIVAGTSTNASEESEAIDGETEAGEESDEESESETEEIIEEESTKEEDDPAPAEEDEEELEEDIDEEEVIEPDGPVEESTEEEAAE